MSVYLSGPVREELRAAQELLDRHVPASDTGLCLRCGEPEDCSLRRTALRTFGRYGCLPRRWPGATRPELVGARSSWRHWWGPAPGEASPAG